MDYRFPFLLSGKKEHLGKGYFKKNHTWDTFLPRSICSQVLPETCRIKQGCKRCDLCGRASGWEAFYCFWHKSKPRWFPPMVRVEGKHGLILGGGNLTHRHYVSSRGPHRIHLMEGGHGSQ